MKNLKLCGTMFAIISACSGSAVAANTSGVFSPVVDPEDRSAMARWSFVPGEDGAKDSSALRIHYQHAINERFRWRAISQFRDVNNEFEYDYLRAELLWYLTPNSTSDWDSGLRFDIRTRKGDRPETFAVNWTNQWQLSSKWRLRGIVSAGWDFGGQAVGGTNIETRASITYKSGAGPRVGVEMFNDYGRISDLGSWNEQEHQLGPVISGSLGGIKYQLGYLSGISSSADDHTFRLWLSRAF